jgi:hypothetical protein
MNHRHHWEIQKEFRRLFRAVNSAEKHARKLIALLAEHSELKPSLTDEQLGQLHECRLFLSWLSDQAVIRGVPEDRPVRRRQPKQKRPSGVSQRKRTRRTKKRKDHAAGRKRL